MSAPNGPATPSSPAAAGVCESGVSPVLECQSVTHVIPHGPELTLGQHETRVLELVLMGYTSQRIALEMGRALKTIEQYRRKMRAKGVIGLVRQSVRRAAT